MKKLFIVSLILTTIQSFSQISFSDSTGLLSNQNFYSFVPVAVVDMNGDKLDDIVRLDSGRIMSIEYQVTSSNFATLNIGSVSNDIQWSICIADVDKNGYNDILTGGYKDSIKIFKADNNGSSFTSDKLPEVFFLQGSNFIDINNDGWIDIFACNDEGMNNPYGNDGAGNFVLDTSLIPTVAAAGNYAGVWSDYDNDGDQDLYISKCYSMATLPTDIRRINLLYQNDGNDNYTEVGDSAGVADGSQSWASDFADIDNDGDMDLFVLNHMGASKLYENNGDGTFTDIMSSSGINLDPGLDNYQVIFRDFDNDGYVDLLVGGQGSALYKNNGNKSFSEVNGVFSDTVFSFAAGDLNTDGFIDIYAIYSPYSYPVPVFNKPDRVLINNGNSNNFLVVNLEGTSSNINGIGARLELYGSWGLQVREVRSGESYGIMNSFSQHFGIGTSTQVDSLVIKWPSGLVQKITNISSNQFLDVTEGITPGMNEIQNKQLSYEIYPNPIRSIATLKISSTLLSSCKNLVFVMYDLYGREVKRIEEIKTSEMYFSRENLSDGLYFYQLTNDKRIIGTGKLSLN